MFPEGKVNKRENGSINTPRDSFSLPFSCIYYDYFFNVVKKKNLKGNLNFSYL